MVLICLQFYFADRDKAMRLARMIADIEPAFNQDVEMLFCARFDTPHDSETMDYVRQKMGVRTFTTVTKWQGWPGGPNGMARDVLREIGNGQNAMAEGAIMIEPDCVPCAKDWINQLANAWRDTDTNEVQIMGAWRDSGPPGGHINGNCVITPEIGQLIDLSRITEHYAWDCHVSQMTRAYWKETTLIRNLFGTEHAEQAELEGSEATCDKPRPVLIHGVKDDSCYEWARNKLFQ